MTISLNGTTGITTPAEVVNGDETVTGNLNVTGNVTVTGLINANGGGIIKSGTTISTATTSFSGATTGSSTALTAGPPTSGTIQIGQVIKGTNIAAGTSIIAQQNGTPGGAGVYTLSQASTGTVSGAITVVGVDFYNIPSTAKRITVMFNGVGVSGGNISIQIGTTLGIEATAYSAVCTYSEGVAMAVTNSTTSFVLATQGSDDLKSGLFQIATLGSNIWVASGVLKARTGAPSRFISSSGDKTLTTGVLDRVRIATDGTNTYSAGSINILYE